MSSGVHLTTEAAREIAQALEAVVVSLARIGSREVRPEWEDDPLRRYLGDGGAWLSLSRARSVLAEAMDRDLGETATEELVSGVEYWTGP
ncbi:MAG TPA: hypothetical protein PLZ93_08065 [Nocardioides sp.]|uniref:hypothetical protein n=1 Tax=uncultured Nocardioides sp. TaxID=198441 RepID=UPI000EEACF48|nr:hypothetical protein [uncultured Nocardioides sp.]HCB05502.1 hypothetical protein [Nocardioides sp.]HRI95555.1 hypothetical protein [Nocardioides sp.]HRK45912.1 hypothetical protein [Nocardioides sp.]